MSAFLCVLLFNGLLAMIIRTVEGALVSENAILSHSMIDVDEFLANLPPYLMSLSHQAGGSLFNRERRTLGMLQNNQGDLLKPIDEKSINEVKFYDEVKNGKHPKLAKFVPDFHRVVSLPYKDKTVDFIEMENLGYGFQSPCVIDLKIGEQTWVPGASKNKIDYEKSKCTQLKILYGFFMPGYQVINPETNELTKLNRDQCRALSPEGLVEKIEGFVHSTGKSRLTAALAKDIIGKLKPILGWASTQTELRLYASSILIMYDSYELMELGSLLEEEPDTEIDIVKLKMVDFAHVYEDTTGDIDTNYLKGVESVMKIFQNILKKHSNPWNALLSCIPRFIRSKTSQN